MKNWIVKFGGWLPIFIVVASIFLKAYYIKDFASSGDDNLVASSILYGKKPFNESKFRITINDKAKPTYYSIPKKLARKLDSTDHLMPILSKLHFLFPLYAVPNETTYAPLQFFLTVFLVRDTQSMFTNIVMGRLPSLLVHFFGLLLFLYLMVKYFNGGDNPVALCLSLLVLSFNFEHVMYAFQMESYAIGVFGVFLLILGYFKYLDKYLIDEKSSLINVGLFCALLMLMQYQLLFFSFAAVCSVLYFSYIANLSFRLVARRMIYSGIVFLIFFIPIFFIFLSKHTEHVAKFLIGEGSYATKYWFPGHKITGFVDGMIYSCRFFSLNLLEVFRSMTYLFTPDSIAETISFGLNLILFTVGFFYVILNKQNKYLKWMKVFLFFSSIVWLIIIITGRVALTPDRHSLILLPIFIFFIYFGLVKTATLLEYFRFRIKYLNTGAILVTTFILFYSTNQFLSKRIEPLLLAGFYEQNIPDNSLIITNDRMLYLFSKKKGVPVYLEVNDKSRQGWLLPPIKADYFPQRVYYVLRDQRDLVGLLDGEFEIDRSEKFLPDQIKKENIALRDLFLSKSYKLVKDTVYTIIDDEVNKGFHKRRDERILILDKY